MKSTTRRQPLRPEAIVAAAMEIADERGVDSLSMRNLAERLGFGVMALYNHVANKDELLALMVDAVSNQVDTEGSRSAPLEVVREIAVSIRTALVRHPWTADLWQRHLPGPARNHLMEQILRLLDESGLSPELAHHGFHAITNHVVGYTLQELGMTLAMEDPEATASAYVASLDPETLPHMIAHVHQHLDGDTASSFELVLDLILDGLVRLNETG